MLVIFGTRFCEMTLNASPKVLQLHLESVQGNEAKVSENN